MKTIGGVTILAMLAVLGFASMPLSIAGATHGNIPPGMTPASTCMSLPVTSGLPVNTFYDEASYECQMIGILANGGVTYRYGWDTVNIFAVSNDGATPLSQSITITDCCYVGDVYNLFYTPDSNLLTGWVYVGQTPNVRTDSNLVAPTYNALWTGTGVTLSSATFTVSIPAGTTYYFRVQDRMMANMAALAAPCGVSVDVLLSVGCSVAGISAAGGWSPAGFSITI